MIISCQCQGILNGLNLSATKVIVQWVGNVILKMKSENKKKLSFWKRLDGKRVMSPEEKEDYYKLTSIINLIVFLIAIFIVGGFSIYTINNIYDKIEPFLPEKNLNSSEYLSYNLLKNVDIHYVNLTDKEIEKVEKVIRSLSVVYLITQQNITFVENISEYCEHCGGIYYRINKEIFILYMDDLKIFKNFLCHEILHVMFLPTVENNPYKDPVHAIIYSLAEEGVCYNKESEKYILD